MVEIKLITSLWGARMAGAVSHPTIVAWVRFQPGVIRVLSFLLVLMPCSEAFSPGSPVFHPPQKPTSPNSNSNRGQA